MSESDRTIAELPAGVKLIPLTKGKFAEVDAADFDRLNKHHWCVKSWNKTFYAKSGGINLGNDRHFYMHNVIMGAKNIDHVDGNGLNNRRSNLRIANKSQNGANRGPTKKNTSGFKGVHWFSPMRTWKARITARKQEHHLGYFKNPADGARAYDEAAVRLFGEFALTNKMMGLL